MFRKTLLVASFLGASLLNAPVVFAQQKPSIYGDQVKADVKLNYVYTLEEALARARAEKKLIFFNCFADWAVPCHGMNKHVFSDQGFADYMNRTFVNLFIDVSDREQAALVKRYNIQKFAHFLILNAQGDVVHRIVGGKKLPDFQKDVQLALSDKTSLAGTMARYAAGKTSKSDLLNLLHALQLADDQERFTQVATQYLGQIKKADYAKAENWFIISRQLTDTDSDLFTYFTEHKADFVKENGVQKVNNLLEHLFYARLAAQAAGTEPYQADELLNQYLAMQKAALPDSSLCYRLHQLAKLRGERQYDALIDYMEREGGRLGQERVALALTFDFPEQSEAQKKRTVTYLRNLAQSEPESVAKHLNAFADRLERYDGITFENSSFAEALAKAKAEGSYLFLDAYTSWCGPCKQMAKDVFPRPEVGRAFTQNRLLAIKMDMEKGEGPAVAKRYEISAYPTMLILDGEGNVVKRIVGARPTARFIQDVSHLPRPEYGYDKVKAAYNNGDRTPNIVYYYARLAADAGDLKQEAAAELLDEMYRSLSDEAFCSPSASEFVAAVRSTRHPVFERLVQLYPTRDAAQRATFSGLMANAVLNDLNAQQQPLSAEECSTWHTRLTTATAQTPDAPIAIVARFLSHVRSKDHKTILGFYTQSLPKCTDSALRLRIDRMLLSLLADAPRDLLNQAVDYMKSAQQSIATTAPEHAKEYLSLTSRLAEMALSK